MAVRPELRERTMHAFLKKGGRGDPGDAVAISLRRQHARSLEDRRTDLEPTLRVERSFNTLATCHRRPGTGSSTPP